MPTSITAFVGRALRGPVDDPQRISSFADFVRIFGGLWSGSLMSYSVQQYYQNGGSEAVIVRVDNGGAPATVTLPSGPMLRALSRGLWGNSIRARVDRAGGGTYDLFVRDMGSGAEERYFAVSNSAAGPRPLANVLQSSLLVEYVSTGHDDPAAHAPVPSGDWFTDAAQPADTVLASGQRSRRKRYHVDRGGRQRRFEDRHLCLVEDKDIFNLPGDTSLHQCGGANGGNSGKSRQAVRRPARHAAGGCSRRVDNRAGERIASAIRL